MITEQVASRSAGLTYVIPAPAAGISPNGSQLPNRSNSSALSLSPEGDALGRSGHD
jgi:hypothetical protein